MDLTVAGGTKSGGCTHAKTQALGRAKADLGKGRISHHDGAMLTGIVIVAEVPSLRLATSEVCKVAWPTGTVQSLRGTYLATESKPLQADNLVNKSRAKYMKKLWHLWPDHRI